MNTNLYQSSNSVYIVMKTFTEFCLVPKVVGVYTNQHDAQNYMASSNKSDLAISGPHQVIGSNFNVKQHPKIIDEPPMFDDPFFIHPNHFPKNFQNIHKMNNSSKNLNDLL